MDPRHVVSQLLSGQGVGILPTGQHETLIVAEQAIGEGHTQLIDDILPFLNDIESHILQYRFGQLANDIESSQESLATALEISRTKEHRDHLMEARIRMEWGVLRASLGEMEQAGIDLKWAVERMGALSEGHRWHGLALLNLATWHRNRGESGMALAIHSEISRHGPHLVEIISMSRRSAAEILIEKDHLFSALRNLWIAHHGFRQSSMEVEAVEAGLHWIDLGLTDVSVDAPEMEIAIETAAPRSVGEPKPRLWIHPSDLGMMCEWIEPRIDHKDAIAVLDDARHTLHS